MRPFAIGIIGLNFGKHLIAELLLPENRAFFRIAAVCDLDRDKAETMGKQLGVKAYTDIDSLLADRDIPVIGLFTGPNGRAALLRRIFLAGKDVMTTKPFEVDPEEAAAILREAVRRKRVVHLNSPAPGLSPDFEQIARWRQRFNLGRPIAARAEAWASYREKADGTWYDDPGRCPVAPVFRLGIYLINDLIRLFGPAQQVQVIHSRLSTRRPTPDNAQLGILFKNGALANIYASFCIDDTQEYRNSLTLNFERGTIYRDVGSLAAKGKPVQLELITKGAAGRRIVTRKAVASRSGVYQWPAFYRAVQRRKPPTAAFIRELVDGLRVITAMSRAEQSASTAEVV